MSETKSHVQLTHLAMARIFSFAGTISC